MVAGDRNAGRSLGQVLVERDRPDLRVRHVRDRVSCPGVQPEASGHLELGAADSQLDLLAGCPVASHADIELAGLPGCKTDPFKFGEPSRVTGRDECLVHGDPDRRVMTMPVGVIAAPGADHDLRLRGADRPDDLRDEAVLAPLLERLRTALAVVVVVERTEPRLAAVDRARLRGFPGAVHPKLGTGVRRDAVLTAFAARGRPADDARGIPLREHRYQGAVLIVRMRSHVQNVGSSAEAVDEADEARDARVQIVTHGRVSEIT